MTMRRTTLLLASVLVLGCGGTAEEEIQTAKSALSPGWTSWSDSQPAANTVGMGHIKDLTYQWFVNGTVCRGDATAPCSEAVYSYLAPDSNYGAIQAVGISNGSSHVAAWYADGSVSVGTSDDLTHYNSKVQFIPPRRPAGGSFTMSQLIDADSSDNGDWYFYWRDGATVYRTTGTYILPELTSSAVAVNVLPNANIVGIAFDDHSLGGHSKIMTYYDNGTVNASTSSLDLAQGGSTTGTTGNVNASVRVGVAGPEACGTVNIALDNNGNIRSPSGGIATFDGQAWNCVYQTATWANVPPGQHRLIASTSPAACQTFSVIAGVTVNEALVAGVCP